MSRYYSSILNVLSPSFANTYSLAFDGVDDFLDITPSYTLSGEFGISVWFKNDVLGNDGMLLGKGVSGTNSLVWLYSTTKIYVNVGGSTATFNNDGTNPIPTSGSSWANLLIWRDNTDTVHCYLNNQNFGTLSISNPTQTNDFTFDRIGGAAATYFWNGNIDEVSIYNTALSLTDRNTIYGTGKPSDISSISGLIAWYRMGDNGSYKSPQWLIPNNSNKDDYINTGTNSLIGASTLTISAWFKSSDVDSQYLLGDTSVRFSIRQSNGDTRISFTGSTDPFRGFGIPYNVGEWNNIILTFDGSLVQADRLKLYHNGVEINNINAGTPSTTLLLNTAASFMIGRVGGTLINTWNGSIDEVAYWNSVQNASTIYNSGTPADLTSLSPLSWWRMGEDSTFNTNWTVPDQVGSNDGTSANMTIEV
jgi:hypothetical protein